MKRYALNPKVETWDDQAKREIVLNLSVRVPMEERHLLFSDLLPQLLTEDERGQWVRFDEVQKELDLLREIRALKAVSIKIEANAENVAAIAHNAQLIENLTRALIHRL